MASELNQDDVPTLPVGTLAELERDGFDPRVYASCARPVKDPETGQYLVVGCKQFDKCTLSCRAKSGPHFYGVEVIKGQSLGGHVIRRTLHCTKVVIDQEYHELNEGVLTIIADEGETYKNFTVKRAKNEMGLPEQREMEEDVVVPVHPRPNNNPALVKDRLKAMARKRELDRKRDERVAPALGIPGKSTPLDSPERRGSRKPAPDGGGKSE